MLDVIALTDNFYNKNKEISEKLKNDLSADYTSTQSTKQITMTDVLKHLGVVIKR